MILIAVTAVSAIVLLLAIITMRTVLLERSAGRGGGHVERPALVRRLDRIGMVLALVAFTMLVTWVMTAPLRW